MMYGANAFLSSRCQPEVEQTKWSTHKFSALGTEKDMDHSMIQVRASEVYPSSKECEKEEPGLEIPFHQLPGESCVYVGKLVDGIVAVSNYRLFLSLKSGIVNLPLGLIESVELKAWVHIHIMCKDARVYRLKCHSGEQGQEWLARLSSVIIPPRRSEDFFSFAFRAHLDDQPDGPGLVMRLSGNLEGEMETLNKEMSRLRMDKLGAWRISKVNENFELSPSYPRYVIVPAGITDQMLVEVAKFRGSRRFPAVVWRHPGTGAVIARCSQPEVGIMGWRCTEDEELMRAIAEASAETDGGRPLSNCPLRLSSGSCAPHRARRGTGGSEFAARTRTAHEEFPQTERTPSGPHHTRSSSFPGHLLVNGSKLGGAKTCIDSSSSSSSSPSPQSQEERIVIPANACNGDVDAVIRSTDCLSNANNLPDDSPRLPETPSATPDRLSNSHPSPEQTALSKPIPVPHTNGDSVGSPADACSTCSNGSLDGPPPGALNGDSSFCSSIGSSPPLDVEITPVPSTNGIRNGQKLLIIDARSYGTALANRARGGGCECPEYYPSCEIDFMNLQNIHGIRKSFLNLRLLHTLPPEYWWQQLEASKWLHHISALLRAALVVVRAVHEEGRPVVVHCSDGWDRTTQIVSLAQILLDPYYRTMEGFSVLVDREWIKFGHKFADRHGHSLDRDDPNERCPIFLQWLDCVHQLIDQFPTAFEFTGRYLVTLLHHSYSGLFGNFLFNREQERVQRQVHQKTPCVWSFLRLAKGLKNYLYTHPCEELPSDPLQPQHHPSALTFWTAAFSPEMRCLDKSRSWCRRNEDLDLNECSTDTVVANPLMAENLTNGHSERQHHPSSALSDLIESLQVEPPMVDGSPYTKCPEQQIQLRVAEMITGFQAEISALRQDLFLTREALQRKKPEFTVDDPQNEELFSLEASTEGSGTGGAPGRGDRQAAEGVEGGGARRMERHLSSSSELSSCWEAIDVTGSLTNGPPTKWTPDHAVANCQACQQRFWLGKRRHHCRACGQVFCANCSSFYAPLPLENLDYPVRQCFSCYESNKEANPTASPSSQPAVGGTRAAGDEGAD
ncbi:unnamed protein product [Cyprideis torosa]|uniref:phosphatidylinositol-3,5-bisphosphate 3-phosphatase n=2 Tax=Cyprideis torosa TaxID=163714 RepID=A0A7R8WAM6_9CRUS|nr:unnamed protein product [Cyprideis torosa]CAG0889854.1 unnamed protein product [Cyprideis torosa]